MAISPLIADALIPDKQRYQSLFTQSAATVVPGDAVLNFSDMQPRLDYALQQFTLPRAPSRFMLVKMPDETAYLQVLAAAVRNKLSPRHALYGGRYCVELPADNQQPAPVPYITLQTAQQADDDFAVSGEVQVAQWAEYEALFGCVRQFFGTISLHPGLVHRANGGVLLISLRAILAQPVLWLRLKQMVESHYFHWYAPDESRPLPVAIPPLPLQLSIILVGERELLAEFQQLEPVLSKLAIYSEFAEEVSLDDEAALAHWCQWVNALACQQQLPLPDSSAWPALLQAAVRFTGDQTLLPLSPGWLVRELSEMLAFCDETVVSEMMSGETAINKKAAAPVVRNGITSFSGQQFQHMQAQRQWREDGLYQQIQREILSHQVILETEGQRIGQINGLAVVEYPGHPRSFGEPARLSCVVHIGDGELMDVERKAELGGNIHAKGMMIMQAFLLAALRLEQQLPFSASLTFEQSYSEIDGDSASMAELCVLISALANVPLYQHMAITGAVDQFGRSMSVGGINEKIEGFFAICQQRGLSGQQGVIIPASNQRHLCLNNELQTALEGGQFHIWAVDHVADALLLLSGLPWEGEEPGTLLQLIQARIAQACPQESRHRCRWLNWFAR